MVARHLPPETRVPRYLYPALSWLLIFLENAQPLTLISVTMDTSNRYHLDVQLPDVSKEEAAKVIQDAEEKLYFLAARTMQRNIEEGSTSSEEPPEGRSHSSPSEGEGEEASP